MKDNEIIETWQKLQDILKRTENVILQKDAIDDLVRHITNILDLINRQKADYDRLQKAYFRNQEIFAEQSLENERLKAEIERLEIHTKMHDEIKAEAYKECIEKVKEELADWVGADNSINYFRIKKVCDNLLNEMVGESQ